MTAAVGRHTLFPWPRRPMPTLTLSEALAEAQAIDRWIARKQQLIAAYLLRPANLRDPLARDGGTPVVLARERQSILALYERKGLLRRLVQAANERTIVTHEEDARPVADWLVWKREVHARRAGFLTLL